MCRNRPLTPWWRPSPEALYILFGTNTLVNGSEDTATKFITYYEKMIDMFHESLPNVPIYVQSIPGVQEWVKDSKPGLQNDRHQAGQQPAG